MVQGAILAKCSCFFLLVQLELLSDAPSTCDAETGFYFQAPFTLNVVGAHFIGFVFPATHIGKPIDFNGLPYTWQSISWDILACCGLHCFYCTFCDICHFFHMVKYVFASAFGLPLTVNDTKRATSSCQVYKGGHTLHNLIIQSPLDFQKLQYIIGGHPIYPWWVGDISYGGAGADAGCVLRRSAGELLPDSKLLSKLKDHPGSNGGVFHTKIWRLR